MGKFFGVVILLSMQTLSVYGQSNRFDFDNWPINTTSQTITVGSCSMGVNVSGSNFLNSSPRWDDADVSYSPTNGTGLALDHNWINTGTSTTVTLTFSPAILNPTFVIYDINRNNPCGAFCSGAWTDLVTVQSNTGTLTATSQFPSEQTITNVNPTTKTITGNMICGALGGYVTISVTGTISTITITYSSGATVDRTSATSPNSCGVAGGETNCRNNRVNCADPGRQYITIGSISGSTCCLGSPAQRDTPLGQQCSGTQLNFSSSPVSNNGTLSYSWTSNNPAGTTGTASTFSFNPVNNTCPNNTVVNVTAGITSIVNTGVNRGQTLCNVAFTPNIKPIPTLSLTANVDCEAATVAPDGALLCGAPCASCSYVLQSCTGCVVPSDPVLTTNPFGSSFDLWGATSAGFSATLNGCSSATQSLNFLGAPYSCASPLSAELNEFNINCTENNTQLNWVIASQKNNSFFTIERSSDGLIFEMVKNVPGSGTTNNSQSYTITDNRPIIGTSYYRLSQTDFDGSNTILGLLSSEWPCDGSTNDFQIFPNPSEGNVQVVFSHNRKDEYNVECFNALGQIVINPITGMANEFGSTLINLETQELPVGLYMVRVKIDEKIFTKKLVKE